MSTVDLDQIRAEWDDVFEHTKNHWACCRSHAAARHIPALLAEVERLQRDYEDAHADRLARMLERDRTIDEREYLKSEVERLRAELRDAGNDLLDVRGILAPNGYPRRVPVDLVPTVAPAVEWLADEVDRLRGVLREVLGEFTDKGSIGAIHNVQRSRWVNVGTVDRWRAAAAGEDAEP